MVRGQIYCARANPRPATGKPSSLSRVTYQLCPCLSISVHSRDNEGKDVLIQTCAPGAQSRHIRTVSDFDNDNAHLTTWWKYDLGTTNGLQKPAVPLGSHTQSPLEKLPFILDPEDHSLLIP